MEDGTLRVVVVEDNDVFRDALEILLSLTPDLEVVAAVSEGRAAVSECASRRPDVVLVDYRLPDLDGVETTEAIRAACPGTAVVGLTAAAGAPEIDAMLAAGAVECLTKDRQLDEIAAAIRAAAERGASAR
jgi:DNA-binding NarL/FixJ family response regulator